MSPLRRPDLRRRVAICLGAVLFAASACSSQFDTDNLSRDASSGSTVDGGGGDDDGGGEGDGSPGGGGDAGGGGNPDGGGGGNPDGSPPPPDGSPPPPDAGGGGECGGEGQACCAPMDTDSCNDEFLECTGGGGTCEPCGNSLGAPCCETAPECSGLLGLTCGLLNACTGL